MSFAHTIGEFGVVLMLGGSIPGVTRVASIALYDEVQKLNYPAAHSTALVLLGISFVLIFAIAILQRLTRASSMNLDCLRVSVSQLRSSVRKFTFPRKSGLI